MSHLAERPTRILQDRRTTLLQLARGWTADERTELRAIEAELQQRQVLSIGINF